MSAKLKGRDKTKMKSFTVGVFTEKRENGKPRISAYIRDYNKNWENCCEHVVYAENGKGAKKTAIEQHKIKCLRLVVK